MILGRLDQAAVSKGSWRQLCQDIVYKDPRVCISIIDDFWHASIDYERTDMYI